ncbi:hypothetical protein SESBI_37725 [Sesbania bispinosa]|nr:hypothetical protein SESBI_37725 [Sesbania bispinosa]
MGEEFPPTTDRRAQRPPSDCTRSGWPPPNKQREVRGRIKTERGEGKARLHVTSSMAIANGDEDEEMGGERHTR